MSKKYIIPGTLVVLVLITWLAFGSDSTESTALYATPQSGSFEVTITTTGELRAKNATSIQGPMNMREYRIYNVTIQDIIPEGTIVQKGDYIAELDRSQAMTALQDAQLSLEEAEAELEIAQLDSTQTLSQARDEILNMEYTLEEAEIAVEQSQYESPAVQRQAQIDLDRARRQLEQIERGYEIQRKQAEARIREIKADLAEEQRDVQRIQEIMEQFTIYAPENGMVIYRRNRDGSKVMEGSEVSGWSPVVAELPDFSQMESVTYVNEVDIQSVRRGQPVNIGLDAMPDKNLTGVVTDVANIGEQRPNSNSKVFQVIIDVNGSDSTLRPAMTTSNLITVNSLDSATYVPLETVHTHDEMDFVYKQEGTEMIMQQVILGMMNENNVVIHEGVELSDRLHLSTPEDTSGVRVSRLPEEVMEKYRDIIEEQQEENVPPEQRVLPEDARERMQQMRQRRNSGEGAVRGGQDQ